MKTQSWTAAAVAVAVLSIAGAAHAQTKDETHDEGAERARLAPVDHAVELTVATGYQQGFGKINGAQPSLTDLGTAGGGVQLSVGYRFIPQLTLAVYGAGAMFGRGDRVDSSSSLYTATAGVQADWHFLPAASELDPWVSLGTGWRGYWVGADAGTTALHGLELAKVQVGVDYRIDRAIAISPVIGADLSTFLTETTPAQSGFANVASPNVNTFVFGGVQGRFDVATAPSPRVASR